MSELTSADLFGDDEDDDELSPAEEAELARENRELEREIAAEVTPASSAPKTTAAPAKPASPPLDKSKRGPGRPRKDGQQPAQAAPATAPAAKKPASPEKPVAAPRPAVGVRVAPDQASDPYKQLDTLLEQERGVIEEIRKRHPESEIGDALDPRERPKRPVFEVSPIPVELLAALMHGMYRALAARLDVKFDVDDKSWMQCAKQCGEALRYACPAHTPGGQAAFAAIISIIVMFSPLIAAPVSRLLPSGKAA